MPLSAIIDHPSLDNPVWHALSGPHRPLAESCGHTRWYPGTIAPFIAVPSRDVVPELDAAARRGFKVPAYFVGVLPDSLPGGWRFAAQSQVLQLVPTHARVPQTVGDDIRVLGSADRPGMLALAQVAFPDFFREHTAALGEYLGIFDGARLIAMAGERIALDGMQEISGVCTHPEFAGRGCARRLTSALLTRHRGRGVASFLHVSEGNAAARRVYESMGFILRASLPLGQLERTEPASESKNT